MFILRRCKSSFLLYSLAAIVFSLIFSNHQAQAKTYTIGVLMLGDVRSMPVAGLKEGLKQLGYEEGKNTTFYIMDAENDRSRLTDMAKDIIARKVDVAIAAGGVEADALKHASAGTGLPVVFLAVASAVERGLVKSMSEPGGNITGIDTNDTQLTAKRLAYVRKMFPKAKRILIPSMPSLTPSAKAVEVAQKVAPELGFEIVVLEGSSKDEIKAKAAGISSENIDVIYIGLAAPVWQIEKEVFFPISESQKIPIMGVDRETLMRGALASYACSRYATGVQAARLVKKILEGVAPQNIPVETPDKLEFLINKWVVERLGLELPRKMLNLADEIVNIPVD